MFERDVLNILDEGEEPEAPCRFNFASNANSLGPDPYALKAIRQADPRHYPDPHYRQLYRALAEFHDVEPEQIAVGAGSSELIARLTHWSYLKGPMLLMEPTFAEYSRAAQPAELPLRIAHSGEEFLSQLKGATLAFLCVPNNPTGEVYAFLEEAAWEAKRQGIVLVLDLAYWSLTRDPPPLPEAWWLFGPNKAHGLTGERAGYLIAPQNLHAFRSIAPSWILSVHGEAFLRQHVQPNSQAWLAQTRQTLWHWLDALEADLAQLGLEVRKGRANFLLAKVGQAPQLTLQLRAREIRVRDCSSFHLPEWIRLSAQPETARRALIQALSELLAEGVLPRPRGS